jgi:hypothetical protein
MTDENKTEETAAETPAAEEKPKRAAKKSDDAKAKAKAAPKATAKAESKDERASEEKPAAVGHDSEASDADNPNVTENLSPEGQEAAEKLDDEALEEADLALDASGPLHLQDPAEREMTGAVSEEQAKEQEATLAGVEDLHGSVSEAGEPASERKGEVKQQEDVIDFPPPVAEREPDPRRRRVFEQKGQLYTDGLSGAADSNLERAYEIPEALQSSNPEERAAGDESNPEPSGDTEERSEERSDS